MLRFALPRSVSLLRAPLPVAALCALLAVASCTAFGPQVEDPYWVERELEDGPPRRDLLQACGLAVVRADFPPGELDEVAGRVTSGWDVNLAPYSKRGTRSQAIVEVVPREERRTYQLRVRVRVQVNQEVHQPLVYEEAEWEDAREDRVRASEVMEHVLNQVAPRGLSPEAAQRLVE